MGWACMGVGGGWGIDSGDRSRCPTPLCCVDVCLSEGAVRSGVREIVIAISGAVTGEETTTFQTPFVVEDQLALSLCEAGGTGAVVNYTRGSGAGCPSVQGRHRIVTPRGVPKGISSSPGLPRLTCDVLELSPICSSTVIDSLDFSHPFLEIGDLVRPLGRALPR
jgi:hypothetical protein